MSVWPWRWVDEGLKLIPELTFLRDFHVTQSGILAASAFGGMKDVKVMDVMHPASVPERMRGSKGYRAKQLGSAAAERDFKTLVQCGLVSQFVFDALTN